MSTSTGPVQTNLFSFRLDDGQAQQVLALRDTFSPPQVTEAMRWLLQDPRVRSVIRERIADATTPASVAFCSPLNPKYDLWIAAAGGRPSPQPESTP